MKRTIGLHVFICLDGSSLAGLAPSWVLRAASSLGALASLACVLPLGASSLEQVQLASFLAGVGPSLASLVVHPCEGLASCQAVGDQGCWEAVGSWLLQEVVLRMVSVEFSLAEMQPLLFYQSGSELVPPSISDSSLSHSLCAFGHCSEFFSRRANHG